MQRLPRSYSKEFKELYSYWNKKLEESGLVDLEYDERYFTDNQPKIITQLEEGETIPKVYIQEKQYLWFNWLEAGLLKDLSEEEQESLYELFVNKATERNYPIKLVKLKYKLNQKYNKIYKREKK